MKRIVLLVETSREFGRQLIVGIVRYARLNGPWTFYKEPIGLKFSIPHLTRWKPDGIILRDSLLNKELLQLRIPTILAIHDSSYPRNLPVIRTDSRAIAKMASEHLIQKGFTRFAFCGFDHYEWSDQRKEYFIRFNAEAGHDTHVYSPPKGRRGGDWEDEQQHLFNWVKALPKPVGMLTCSDCPLCYSKSIPITEIGFRYGFKPFSIGLILSGSVPQVDLYWQLHEGEKADFGIGCSLGLPKGWSSHQIYLLFDRRITGHLKLLVNPGLFYHTGQSPNKANKGSLLFFFTRDRLVDRGQTFHDFAGNIPDSGQGRPFAFL
jgi:hypothetical protein